MTTRQGITLLLISSFTDVALAAGAGEPAPADSVLQVFFGLILILLLIGATAWMARRFGRFHAGVDGELRLLGGLSVGTRERVVLVQIGETQLLLGVAPGRVQTLHVLAHPLPITPVKLCQHSPFAQRMLELLKQGKNS